MADPRTARDSAPTRPASPSPVSQYAPVFQRTAAYQVPVIRPGGRSFVYPSFGNDPSLRSPPASSGSGSGSGGGGAGAGVRGLFAERSRMGRDEDDEGGQDFGGAAPGESGQFGGKEPGGGISTPGDDPEGDPMDAVSALGAFGMSPTLGVINALTNPRELPSWTPLDTLLNTLGLNPFGSDAGAPASAPSQGGDGESGMGLGDPGMGAGLGGGFGDQAGLGPGGAGAYGGGDPAADQAENNPGGFGSFGDPDPGGFPDAGNFGGDPGSGPGGDSKIVCTAMNAAYGFGSFRQAVWLAQSRDLPAEYQAGYHALFRPLVRAAYAAAPWHGQRLLRRGLEHIARHRTADIWRQKRGGRRDTIGRIERALLEPLCYIVGWAVLRLRRAQTTGKG